VTEPRWLGDYEGAAAIDTARRGLECGYDAMREPLHLLFVEDSPEDVELVERALARDGFAPEIARVCTGGDMERALAEQRWDVICSDYSMPRFEAHLALSVRARLAPDTPFIVVSGSIGEAAAVALLKAGADDCVPKQNLPRLAPAIRREMREAEDRRARRQAEGERARLVVELAQALRIRDDFLAIASHELRTPLTALRLYLHSITRTIGRGQSERVPEKLASADRQIDRLEQLVSDMISVSMIRPHEMYLDIEKTDLSALVLDIVARFEREHGGEAPVTTRVPALVVGRWDQRQMREVLTRLLSNAFKYGRGSPIEVHVEESDGTAVISVVDHGIGIPAEHQEHIFDRFGRAVSVNYGGLGLGLWIARNIVEAHGGTLTVASELDKGSTFVVRLPIALPEPLSGSPPANSCAG
jgi:signal transduction histidine kinase